MVQLPQMYHAFHILKRRKRLTLHRYVRRDKNIGGGRRRRRAITDFKKFLSLDVLVLAAGVQKVATYL